MKLVKIAVLVIGVVISQGAFASAIFLWKTSSLSETITSLEGEVELTDAAVANGAVSYSKNCYEGCTDALSPIRSFNFSVNGQALDLHSNAGGLQFSAWSIFSANFLVEDNRLTNFSLYYNNSESDVLIGSVVAFNTDRGGLCFHTGVCTGATGEFVRVPEPGSIALMGLGVVLAIHRRRKRVPASKKLIELSA